MISQDFNQIVDEQLNLCANMLTNKAQEYATDDDRLHNFVVAAKLQGITKRAALAGMMAKHTVSIYDMCEESCAFTQAVWDEKITDHINYLLLLRAVVREELQENAPVPGVKTAKDYA